jgi:MinD superfamily P-loop ATPase
MRFSLNFSCSECCSKNISIKMHENKWFPLGSWEFKCNSCGNEEIICPKDIMQNQIYDYTRTN